ncbi:MAG: GNAT family N-acetyltransferase [Spartobacteria bacterium]
MKQMPEIEHVDLAIRRAELADATTLAALICELGYETRTAEMEMRLQSILKDSHYTTFVAVAEGRVAGMVGTFCHDSYEHNSPSGRILALVVSETMRRRGIARALIAAAENDLAQKNIRRVALNTRLERKDAHEFYESCGYVRNGFRFAKELPVAAD